MSNGLLGKVPEEIQAEIQSERVHFPGRAVAKSVCNPLPATALGKTRPDIGIDDDTI